MKILIIGERYSPNLGDPIICESVAYLIKKENKELEIDFLDLSGRDGFENPEGSIIKARLSSKKKAISSVFTKLGLDSDYFAFRKYHEKNKAYFYQQINGKNYDLAIFAGGQMFLDYFVFPIQTIVEYLDDKDIPVIFNACGHGEITSKKMRKILGQSLTKENVKFISSRDDLASIQAFLGGSKQEIIKTHDPALWASEVYGLAKKESDTIGLGVMFAYNMSYKKMLDFWHGTIRALDRKNIKWKIFCNGAPHDYEFAKEILARMNYGPEDLSELLIPAPRRPEELVETIAGLNGIISFRLHSHVLACALDVPSLAIIWDEKLKFFFDSLDLGQRVFPIDAEPDQLITALKEALVSGYDRDLIEQQKESLRAILIENSF